MVRLVLVGGAAAVTAGCDILGVACTADLRPNLRVEVREQLGGRAAARGATGLAEHEDGVVTELFGWADSLRLYSSWDRERAGGYRVIVRRPGYKDVVEGTTVDEDACHVKTATVRVELEVDTTAVAQTPISFLKGAQVPGVPVSTGLRVLGDTLAILGTVPALCSELRAVAVRFFDILHIQVEPTRWDVACPGPGYQPFELRYKLSSGRNYILMTSAVGSPALLFQGYVSPQ